MLVDIFCCYARKDQPLLNELKNHLNPLQRQGLITIWADTDINAGTEWEREIDNHLNTAHIILLLVSPDFMDSDYCYSKEMLRAMERHERGEARVIPVILRPVIWQKAPFAQIQALPSDGKPVTSAFWHSRDDAFVDVADGIRKVITNPTFHYYKQDVPGIVVESQAPMVSQGSVVPPLKKKEYLPWEILAGRVANIRARHGRDHPLTGYSLFVVQHALDDLYELLEAFIHLGW